MLQLPQMRTIEQAYRYIKEQDKSTALTPYSIRQAVINGTLASVRSGKKYLISLDTLKEYLSNPVSPQPQQDSGIRRISGR